MKRIIILNDRQFPNGFNYVPVIPTEGITKVAYVEQKILDAVNSYNRKLNVQKIEYLPIEKQFPKYKKGKSNGVLIEEFDINPKESETYIRNGCYVYSLGARCLCRRILLFLFISGATENTRTAFISQTVFPTLIDYAGEFIDSPSYSIANHKFCFINILNKTITSNMILRHLASLCAAGMDYVEVFANSINPSLIPMDLKEFLKEYASKFIINYNDATQIYEDDNYKINFAKKIFIWKTSSMISKLIQKEGVLDFNGSAEKFYWIETLPMSLFAYKQGYTVDYTDYYNFVKTYKSKFSPSSEKFSRCEVLLSYIEKFFI